MKIHLARLVEMEFLLPHKGGHKQPFAYELLYAGESAEGRARLLGLIEVEALTTTASGRGDEPMRSGCGRPLVGVQSGGGRGAVGPVKTSPGELLNGFHRLGAGNARIGIPAPVPSYMGEVAR